MDFASATRRHDRLPPFGSGPGRGARAWRWIAVLVAVAVVHWIAAQWFERNRVNLTRGDHEHVPVQVALLTPERVERQPAQQPAPPPHAPAPAHKRATSPPREQHVLTALQPAKPKEPALAPASELAASAPPAAASANAPT
ncbi:conserved hypothetical protein, partial [Burkholderia sp. H160]